MLPNTALPITDESRARRWKLLVAAGVSPPMGLIVTIVVLNAVSVDGVPVSAFMALVAVGAALGIIAAGMLALGCLTSPVWEFHAWRLAALAAGLGFLGWAFA